MKTTKKITRIIESCCIAAVMVLGACKSEKQVPESVADADSTQSETHALMAVVTAPFTASKYYLVKASSTFTYGIKNDKEEIVIPNIVNPLVNSVALNYYYNQNNTGDKFNGLLFYPGYKNNTLMLIMCMAYYDMTNNTITGNSAYVTLENGLYLGDNSIMPNKLSTADSDPKTLLKAYISDVSLKRIKQVPNGAFDDTIRISRFYLWSDFEKLLAHNNQGKSFVQFDIGFVDKEVVNNYPAWLLNNFTIKQQQGFTVLFHVKDDKGNSILDPKAIYEMDSDSARNNYKNRGLEVGVPCPPRCGTLNL